MSDETRPRTVDLDGPPERARSRPSWGDALSVLFWSDEEPSYPAPGQEDFAAVRRDEQALPATSVQPTERR